MKKYIEKIISLAKKASDNGDIPVGAIVVRSGIIVGEGYNSRNSKKSVIGHAEISAIEMACKTCGDWRLDDCELYVTLSPCMMCAGAIVDSRIKKVYYLCDRTNVCFKCNEYLSIEKVNDVDKCNEYIEILQSFFECRRNNK